MSRVCVITGGSFGIGRAVVERFLEQGYQVFNLDLKPTDVVEDLSTYIQCDVSASDQVTRAVAQIKARVGRIDVLVSNAGVHFSATLEGTSDTEFERVMGINVKGAFYLLKAVLPMMKAQRSGSIVLVGSDQSLVAKKNAFVLARLKPRCIIKLLIVTASARGLMRLLSMLTKRLFSL